MVDKESPIDKLSTELACKEVSKKLEVTWTEENPHSTTVAVSEFFRKWCEQLEQDRVIAERAAGDAYKYNLKDVYNAFNVPEADRLPNAENYVCWPADVDTTSTGVSDVVTCMFNFNFELIDKGNKHE